MTHFDPRFRSACVARALPESARTLPAKYQPVRVIGTGAMGSVVLARDRNLGRLVAVKLLATDCPDFLARLRSEARILARLDHPAIVRVHELDSHGGRLYLAMEYLRGGNLALARMAPAPLVRSLRGVVDALAHAHAHGVVHRDLKPENVLLCSASAASEPKAVLSDFGLALEPRGERNQPTAPIVGTPLTMSPEQIRGGEVGPASDLFSFGVTLYNKLTGCWPFRGRTVDDVFDAILHREPAPLPPGVRVPRRLEAIVDKALAKQPHERFSSAHELGEALDRFLRARTLFALPRHWFGTRRRALAPATRFQPGGLS